MSLHLEQLLFRLHRALSAWVLRLMGPRERRVLEAVLVFAAAAALLVFLCLHAAVVRRSSLWAAQADVDCMADRIAAAVTPANVAKPLMLQVSIERDGGNSEHGIGSGGGGGGSGGGGSWPGLSGTNEWASLQQDLFFASYSALAVSTMACDKSDNGGGA